MDEIKNKRALRYWIAASKFLLHKLLMEKVIKKSSIHLKVLLSTMQQI